MDEERKTALKQLLRERYNWVIANTDFKFKVMTAYIGTESGEESHLLVPTEPEAVDNVLGMISALASHLQAEYLMLVGVLWIPRTVIHAYIGVLMCSDGSIMTLRAEVEREGSTYVVTKTKEEERVVTMINGKYEAGRAF